MDKIGNSLCPKCHSDDLEKVGWNYWYCGGCASIFVITPNGEKNLVGTKASMNGKQPKTTGGAKTPNDVPTPGKLERTKGLEFPTL